MGIYKIITGGSYFSHCGGNCNQNQADIRALRVYFKAKFGSLAKTQQMLHLLADHGV